MKTHVFCPWCATPLNRDAEPGRCPACTYVDYANPIPVAAAIVEMPTGIVLVRDAKWPPKMFGLPTGFVEHREAPGTTIVREVHEELGLVAELVALVGVYGWAPQNQVIVAYHLRADGEITLSEELAEVKVVPIDRLKPWSFGTGLAVADWLASRPG